MRKNMRKKSISIVAGCLVSLLVMTTPVYAAEQVGYHHDAKTDTADYCLSVYDVSIDLSELRECGDEQQMQSKIIESANPAALIRNSADASGNWIRLSYDELTFDFSQFRPEENTDGYTVTVSVPAIKLKSNSEITFQVYVTNNIPEPHALYAFITFADTDLADMEWDVTSNPVMTISDIPTPQKDGYTFLGWYQDAGFNEPFLLPNNADFAEQNILSDMTLYPKWEKDTVFATVHFAGGESADITLDITNGAVLSILNIKTPVKSGYTFLGWYRDADCTDPFLLLDNADYAEQKITGDLTLYPKWEKNTVLATVHFADGSLPDITLDITNGAVLSILNIKTPVKDGYTFSGWYLDSAFTAPFLIPGQTGYAEQEVSGNITLYSKWQPVVVPPVEQPEEPEPPTQSEQPEQPVQPEKPPVSKPAGKPATPEETTAQETEPTLPVQKPDEKPAAQPQNGLSDNKQDAPISLKNDPSGEKEGALMYEFLILALFAAITAGFGFSIAADMRVLNWYQKKKKAYLAKLEMTI